jgi:hypothetical protein
MQLKQMKIATADSNKTSNALLTLQTAYEVKKFYLCVYIYVHMYVYVYMCLYINTSIVRNLISVCFPLLSQRF